MKSKSSIILNKKNVFRIALKILGKKDEKKLKFILLAQMFIGVLELFALTLVALLGTVAINGVTTGKPNSKIADTFQIIGVTLNSFQKQVAVLGLIAAIFMVGRSFASMLMQRKTLFFLSSRSARISTNLMSKLLSTSILTLRERSTQETVYSLTNGVSKILIGTLATAIGVIVDISLLTIISITLLFLDPVIAVSTFLMFSLIGYILHKFMNTRAGKLGEDFASLSIQSNSKILEALSFYREAVIRNRRGYYSQEIELARKGFSTTEAEISFLPVTSKYIIEISLVIGGLLICALQFIYKDASQAIISLMVFLAAGTRIAPAVLRIQQGAVQVTTSISAAEPTFDLITRLNGINAISEKLLPLDINHVNFKPKIEINNLSLKYPGTDKYALKSLNLTFTSGKFIAIVGPSGAGKTTLADCILGIIDPTDGDIKVSSLSPIDAINKWPGAFGYVPQDVVILDGSIKENIGIGFSYNEIRDDLVKDTLRISVLEDFVKQLPNGIETQVGEQGAKLSGGQRQRLGIARAMYTKPKLLVLDEATSSLDGQTEFEIARSIQAINSDVTVIMIAHRLSTIKNADQVVYLEDGKIISIGTFEEVRKNVPNFEKQALLMGL